MKTRTVTTVTNNEDYVRMRIFDGDLQVSEAAEELILLERAQHDSTRRRLNEEIDRRVKAETTLALINPERLKRLPDKEPQNG